MWRPAGRAAHACRLNEVDDLLAQVGMMSEGALPVAGPLQPVRGAAAGARRSAAPPAAAAAARAPGRCAHAEACAPGITAAAAPAWLQVHSGAPAHVEAKHQEWLLRQHDAEFVAGRLSALQAHAQQVRTHAAAACAGQHLQPAWPPGGRAWLLPCIRPPQAQASAASSSPPPTHPPTHPPIHPPTHPTPHLKVHKELEAKAFRLKDRLDNATATAQASAAGQQAAGPA